MGGKYTKKLYEDHMTSARSETYRGVEYDDQGCTTFLGTTSKFLAPEAWHEASSILKSHKHQAPQYGI